MYKVSGHMWPLISSLQLAIMPWTGSETSPGPTSFNYDMKSFLDGIQGKFTPTIVILAPLSNLNSVWCPLTDMFADQKSAELVWITPWKFPPSRMSRW